MDLRFIEVLNSLYIQDLPYFKPLKHFYQILEHRLETRSKGLLKSIFALNMT